MNKIKITLVVLIALLSQVAVAADSPKIAVLDTRRAIIESDEGRKRAAALEDNFSSDKAAIEALQKKGAAIEERYKKDSAVMAKDEKSKIQKELSDIGSEFEFKVTKLQKDVQAAQQQIFKDLSKDFEAAAKAVLDEQKFDIVLRREALMIVTPEYDITDQVIKKMNSK